jgi:tetratricopeptide (TPR) repeat protein
MEEVVPLAEGSNDRAIAFSAIMNLGGVYEEIGKIRECLACFQRGLEMSHQLGRPTAVASSLLNLARIHYRHGEWDRSREEMQEALAIFRRTGASSRLPAVLYSIGALSAFRGDWETLDRAMDEARTWVNAMGDVALLRWIEGFAAQGDILRGRPDAARDRLLPLLDRGGVEESEVTWFLPVLAWAYLETGAIDEAEEIVTEVLRRARGSGNQVALADALWVAGKIAAGRRRWDEARQLFEGGIVLNRDNSFYWAEIRTTFEYGLMQVSAGETDGGRELIEGALRSFRRLGAVPYIARAEQALALL